MDERQHHESMEGLMGLLTKANRDLDLVQTRLEKEFHQIYPNGANPTNLVSRLKVIQQELPLLKQQCQELLAAKQDLIDQASSTLVGNRATVQRMLSSLAIGGTGDAIDVAYSNFKEIVDEWAAQVRSKMGGGALYSDQDINQMLFSAIVHNN